jgi:hypothetical protein
MAGSARLNTGECGTWIWLMPHNQACRVPDQIADAGTLFRSLLRHHQLGRDDI